MDFELTAHKYSIFFTKYCIKSFLLANSCEFFIGAKMLFFELAKCYLKELETELENSTLRTYYWNLKKLNDFLPTLECKNLTYNFVKSYKLHMQKCNNKPSTIAKALSVLRIFTNKMYADKILKQNPFDKIKVPRVYSHRGFLTISELKNLYINFMDYRNDLTKNETNAMRAFLFACFTGLRFGDLKTLCANEIFDYKIRKVMRKTGEIVYIPIPVQARLLLPHKLSGLVLNVTDNSTFNRTLRIAAKKLGCKRRLHSHLARHTFATTCITIGISLSATSKLLGHRNLETTLIYAKYVDTFLDSEMKKFDTLA